ncbi:MAG TPA: C39 family peptidase [Candidatus Stackebrandtia faecavium]|nr:C39 family peptidase [Candidatus Stackebrandtia faecavium]
MHRKINNGIITASLCAALVVIGSPFASSTDPATADPATPTPRASSVVLTTPTEGTVSHNYQVQKTFYWCSAAAARIALSTHDVSVKQSTLAKYMDVSRDGGLPNLNNLRDAMNKYSKDGGYELRQWKNETTLRQQLTKDVISNVDSGHAVIINVTRIDKAKFSGGHYATIVGYRDGGNEFKIADPADSSRDAIWLSAKNVADGVKLNRYVA